MPMPQPIQIALIQQACGLSANDNWATSQSLIEKAAQQGANLVILPELHQHRYFPQSIDPDYFQWAEPIDGPSFQFFSALAQKCHIVLVISIFEKRAEGLYHNTALVIESDGRLQGVYRKMHIPEDPGFHEKYYFRPGDQGFYPIETSIGKLGILICWDQWFPEAARLMALRGAQLLIYPTAIGWCAVEDGHDNAQQLQNWITIQQSHAIANGLFVASCNRIGHEPAVAPSVSQGLDFWGHSFIANPWGEILAQAKQEEAIIIQEVNFAQIERARQVWPFLRDRRPQSYQTLTLSAD